MKKMEKSKKQNKNNNNYFIVQFFPLFLRNNLFLFSPFHINFINPRFFSASIPAFTPPCFFPQFIFCIVIYLFTLFLFQKFFSPIMSGKECKAGRRKRIGKLVETRKALYFFTSKILIYIFESGEAEGRAGIFLAFLVRLWLQNLFLLLPNEVGFAAYSFVITKGCQIFSPST